MNVNTMNDLEKIKQQQMLKLVTKSFYRELVKFGIKSADIVTVSMNLLDQITQPDKDQIELQQNYSEEFNLSNIEDSWQTHRMIDYGSVSIKALFPRLIPEICEWLHQESVKNTYIQLLPRTEKRLEEHLLNHENRKYFAIYENDNFVGIIGGENINKTHQRLEMKKFVGAPGSTGRGIGKTATFLFLYYTFEILKYNKVYIHSIDTNIRNINLNAKFGFEIEGVFFREIFDDKEFHDSVRMGLLKSNWNNIFK